MGINDPHDPHATPAPGSARPEPLSTVSATQEPTSFDDQPPTVVSPVAAAPADDTPPPTEVIPVVAPTQPGVVHETLPPAYVTPDVPYVEERRPAWPYIAAAVALLIGGLVGYLIGAAGDDDETSSAPAAVVDDGEPSADATFDMLLERTRADGEYRSPSEYAQLDEITAIDNAKATEELQSQIALLTVVQTEAAGLTDQVATLEAALAEVTAERDVLLASASTDDGTSSDLQTDLDDANAAIAEITTELDAANANLEAATAAIAERDAAIETIQGQLDTATETLEALNVLPVPSYINGDIDQARTDAEANGWTLIEEPTISESSPVDVVLDQAPPANSNMINGSVLYVAVATQP